jgi:hypothetical protein
MNPKRKNEFTLHPQYRQRQLVANREARELEECTFQPNLKKTSKYFRRQRDQSKKMQANEKMLAKIQGKVIEISKLKLMQANEKMLAKIQGNVIEISELELRI